MGWVLGKVPTILAAGPKAIFNKLWGRKSQQSTQATDKKQPRDYVNGGALG